MTTARQHINALLDIEAIKVWSLVVTLFGDLGREAPVSISGKEIRYLLEHIGIKPAAIRVALHRLKKDGWIVTAKDGRETFYSLSADGLSQTRAAYTDIYRDDVKYGEGWQLQIHTDEGNKNKTPRLPVFKNVAWVPRKRHNQALGLDVIVDTDNMPRWFLDPVVPQGIERAAEAYCAAIKDLSAVLKTCSDLDRAAIRLLALHHWRKMALRDNTWFHIWLFNNGAFAQSYKIISKILKQPASMPLQECGEFQTS